VLVSSFLGERGFFEEHPEKKVLSREGGRGAITGLFTGKNWISEGGDLRT